MVLALAAPLLGGCLGAPQDALDPAGGEQGAEDAALPQPASVVQEWRGHLVVGAANDLPAHFPETAPLVRSVMDAMVNLEIVEVPEALAFELEFTSADLVQAQLMVNGPFRPQGWKEWVSAKSGAAVHCLRVAPGDLEPGLWYAMPHSDVAVNAAFTLRAVMSGGEARFVQAYDRWPGVVEVATALPHIAHRDPLPCAEA